MSLAPVWEFYSFGRGNCSIFGGATDVNFLKVSQYVFYSWFCGEEGESARIATEHFLRDQRS